MLHVRAHQRRASSPPDGPARALAAGGGPSARRVALARRGGVLLLAAVASGVAAAPGSADVARLVVTRNGDLDRPTKARIVVAAPDGTTRTLGPVTFPWQPGSLRASPDGRRLLVLPASPSEKATYAVLPTDGGAPVLLRPPDDAAATLESSDVSWSADGESVLVGDVPLSVSHARGKARQRLSDLRWSALRCDASTGACAAVPPVARTVPSGSALGVPGGTLVSPSLFSPVPATLLLGNPGRTSGESDDPRDHQAVTGWVRRTSARGRRLLRQLDRPRPAVVVVRDAAGGPPRIVSRTTRTLRQGVPVTSQGVGGPSGAQLVRSTVRLRIQRRGPRFRLLLRYTGSRLLTVAPDGSSRLGALPRIRLTAAEADEDPQLPGARSLAVTPTIGLPGGGWLGQGGAITELIAASRRMSVSSSTAWSTDGTLATIDDTGHARPVRIAGRAATPQRLLRLVGPADVEAYAPGSDLVGFERSTGSAIVRLLWSGGRGAGGTGTAFVRVPLDGGAPTRIAGTVDAAW